MSLTTKMPMGLDHEDRLNLLEDRIREVNDNLLLLSQAYVNLRGEVLTWQKEFLLLKIKLEKTDEVSV